MIWLKENFSPPVAILVRLLAALYLVTSLDGQSSDLSPARQKNLKQRVQETNKNKLPIISITHTWKGMKRKW